MEASEQAEDEVHFTDTVGGPPKPLQVFATLLATVRQATCELAAAAAAAAGVEAAAAVVELTDFNKTAAQHAALAEAAVANADITSLETQSQLWAVQFSEQQTALLALLESQSRELAESKQQLAVHVDQQKQSAKAQSDASTQAEAQDRSTDDANSSNSRQHEHNNAEQVAATLTHRENRLFELESEVSTVTAFDCRHTKLAVSSFTALSYMQPQILNVLYEHSFVCGVQWVSTQRAAHADSCIMYC
jgi:hypothetical protein